MNQFKKTDENNDEILSIIKIWGREVWSKPSKPKSAEDRKAKHEHLAKILKENKFSPESISLKHVDQILKITVPIDNGSENSQQMRGAAYWYLREAFLNSNQENNSNPVHKKAA